MYAIDTSEKVSYNGNDYFLRIRTENADNPVVLFLHGGCGSPDRAQVMKFQSPLADKFTVVAWDQRGTGFAYDKREAKKLDLTKDIYVQDARNVVLYLKTRFKKDKIIIVGHSFGSVLGVWLANGYPDDILAYVGIGQCVDYIKNEELSYKWSLDEAKRVDDKKSVKILTKIGFPTNGIYSGNKSEHQKCIMKQRSVLHKLGGATYANRKPYWQELLFHDVPIILKEYNLINAIKYLKGLNYTSHTTLAFTNPDFMKNVTELKVPVYLTLGRYDYNCACNLAELWFENLSAPEKKLIWFEHSAHSPQWEEPDEWNAQFIRLFENLL